MIRLLKPPTACCAGVVPNCKTNLTRSHEIEAPLLHSEKVCYELSSPRAFDW
jgi:hypothetical protein